MAEKCYFHVDVNSAFLSWESVWRLQHGETVDLRDIPSVVGGDQSQRRGIVLAKSTLAKKLYGAKTGGTSLQPIKARSQYHYSAPDIWCLFYGVRGIYGAS